MKSNTASPVPGAADIGCAASDRSISCRRSISSPASSTVRTMPNAARRSPNGSRYRGLLAKRQNTAQRVYTIGDRQHCDRSHSPQSRHRKTAVDNVRSRPAPLRAARRHAARSSGPWFPAAPGIRPPGGDEVALCELCGPLGHRLGRAQLAGNALGQICNPGGLVAHRAEPFLVHNVRQRVSRAASGVLRSASQEERGIGQAGLHDAFVAQPNLVGILALEIRHRDKGRQQTPALCRHGK